MLIEYRIKNFASFKNETVLSAQTGARLYKHKYSNTFEDKKISILKSLLLVGPNGAGKSQLLNGLNLMRNIIIHGGAQTVTESLPYIPFKFDDDTVKQETEFGITLEIDNQIFDYDFSYNQTEITYEKLSEYIVEKDQDKVYFERKGQNFTRLSNSALCELKPRLRKNALFLFLAQQNNDNVTAKIYKWFVQNLVYLGTGTEIPAQMLQLLKNKSLKGEMVSFLQFADFNISDIKVVKRPMPASFLEFAQQNKIPISQQDTLQLLVGHKVYGQNNEFERNEYVDFSQESTGTQRVFYIVLAILFSQINGNGKTILIDEFDESLHRELADVLVKIFNSEVNENQFILVTHDVNLLDDGLRIDQIDFINKNFKGESAVTSLFDYKDARHLGRSDVSWARRYLQGKFGAMPVIDEEGLKLVLKNVHKSLRDSMNEKKKKQ